MGGVGFMVLVVLTFRLIGRHVSLLDRLALTHSLGLDRPTSIVRLLMRTLYFMLFVEALGALSLYIHWRSSGIVATGTVCRAAAVLALSLGVVMVAAWLLLLTQPFTMSQGLFEVVSAFATCGLSLGITGSLDNFGRLIIMVMMFWGRLGALTLVMALLHRQSADQLLDYPEEPVLIG
jgi:Trk-type K+ transport system membrane component